MEGSVTRFDAVALDASEDDRIIALLNDIADTRVRLNKALRQVTDERERLQLSLNRLKETWDRISKAQPFERLTPRRASILTKLTAREVEVLRLIAKGLSTKEIAAQLEIAFKTAVCHRSHILEKMNCHESVSLVRVAIQAGLVA